MVHRTVTVLRHLAGAVALAALASAAHGQSPNVCHWSRLGAAAQRLMGCCHYYIQEQRLVPIRQYASRRDGVAIASRPGHQPNVRHHQPHSFPLAKHSGEQPH